MTDYFHGTDEPAALSLIRDGIVPGKLQQRDRGFFGEGLYVTSQYHTAVDYGRSVVRVVLPGSARTFDASTVLREDSLSVKKDPPDWYDDFRSWYLDSVREAAVWESVPDAEEDEVMARAADEIDPASEFGFERTDFYPRVTKWAREQGYDMVHWTAVENVVVTPDAPDQIIPESEKIKSAARAEGVWDG